MNAEDGHIVVRCRSEEALHRAKSLVNIEFSWCLVAVVGCSLLFYLLLSRRYVEEMEYSSIVKLTEEMDLEEGKSSFLSLGKVMRNVDRER